MGLNVTFNGVVYIVPETGEVDWGGNTTSYLIAIAAGALQKTGGSFTLSAETDFGASFGLQSLYYKSRNSNPAATGILRLNNNSDAVSWRNAANNADLPLIVNSSNQLLYNGNRVLTGTGPADYVSSITGTANQVNASASTGAVTLSLPQSINTSAAVQFGTLGLGSATVASSILSLSSTTLGFLPPRMTTAERDAISSPATGLFIYNTSTGVNNYYNGTMWVAIAAGGTINAGTQYQLGYYAANGTTISGLPLITALRAVESDANGLPVASTVTSTELGYVSGVTSAIQTQLNLKAPLASPTFTGTVTFPSPFTLGATSVTATGTEMNYLVGVTSLIQTQLNAKAPTASPTFTGSITAPAGNQTTVGLNFGTAGTGFYGNGTTGVRFASATSAIVFLDGSGITMNTGTIAMGGNKITGLASGTASGDALQFAQTQKIKQVVVGSTGTATTTTSTSFQDTGLTATITPTSTNSKVLVLVSQMIGRGGDGTTVWNINQSTAGDLTQFGVYVNNTATGEIVVPQCSGIYLDSPATTSARTYKTQFRNRVGGNTCYANGDGAVTTQNYIMLIELEP